MKLRYTRKATRELSEILDYTAVQSPVGERHVSGRLRDMIDLVSQYPEVGRITSKGGLRRLAVALYPYILFYRIANDAVVIHGMRHSARKPIR